jgi:RND family efflux transporter MFP subunit
VTAASKVKFVQAQLDEAKARLARADIRAPDDGVILTRTVEVGQTASAAEPMFRLSKGGEVEMRGQVAEQDLPLLKVGQDVNVKLTGTAAVYPGKIRLLGAIIDPATRLGTARVALSPDPNLRPGAFARADVTVSNAQRTVLPQTAILSDDRGSYVLVVNAQNKVERRAVRVSGMIQSGVTIAEGVAGQDKVVATAGAFLQEGDVVKPVLLPGKS